MRKRISIILLALCSLLQLSAQEPKSKKTEEVQPSISVWNITNKTASIVPTVLDTALYNFQNEDPINDYSIANAYNGTLGSPLQSRIYFDRTEESNFLFSRPFDAYFIAPEEVLFFNTKTPYANLNYLSNGSTATHEDDFKAVFSINANKKLNFTGLFEYMFSNGYYDDQTAKQAKAGIWSSYYSRHYALNAIYMYHQFNAMENGGITDPIFITYPDTMDNYLPSDIPTKLSGAQSRYKNSYIYLNQKFHLASVKHQIDSNTVEYKPIASLSHTVKYEWAQKRYLGDDPDSLFYNNTYYSSESTLDSVRYRSLRNNVAFSINEGFSRWFPLSLIGYVEHDYREYYNSVYDSIKTNAYESDITLGAEMSKRTGEALLFDGRGEITTIGDRSGDVTLEGGMSSSFPLFSNKVSLRVDGSYKNTSPTYFEKHYFSNHFMWDNDFDKTQKTRFQASAGWQNKWFELVLNGGVENVSNLIYYDENALPAQYADNIQVMTTSAELNLNLGILHLQNKATQQTSTNETLMPLPEFCTYNNVFFAFKMFKKVLHTQIGADMYYFTSYYAPTYMPATGIFYNQSQEKVGYYPVMSAYLNFHLKTARFFFKYYHFNASVEPKYFSMPNYPLYAERFKMGISWNFYD